MSQPWMVRINELWLFAQNPLTEEQEGPREPKTEPKTEADKKVIKWEQQQIRNSRISAQHFQLEVCVPLEPTSKGAQLGGVITGG